MLKRQEIHKIQKQMRRPSGPLPMVFHALSDPSRFRIFTLMLEHRGMCVTDLAGILKVSVPAASQQLKMLEMTGLVARERMGKMVCYEVNRGNRLVRAIGKLLLKQRS